MAEGKTGSAGLFAKRVQKQLSRAQEKVLVLKCFFDFTGFLTGPGRGLSFHFSKWFHWNKRWSKTVERSPCLLAYPCWRPWSLPCPAPTSSPRQTFVLFLSEGLKPQGELGFLPVVPPLWNGASKTDLYLFKDTTVCKSDCIIMGVCTYYGMVTLGKT